MVFKSDRQRKFVMSRMNKDRTPNQPRNITSNQPKLSPDKRQFVSDAISKEIRAGKPRKQAIAIGFSKARAKFGNSGLQVTRTIKNRRTDNVDKRTRSLLFTLLGVAIALRILREVRK